MLMGGGEPPCAKLGDMTKSTLHRVTTSWSNTKNNLNHSVSNCKIGKYFKLEARKTSFTNELRAGTATFLTMAYIISVNSSVVADSGGSCSTHDTNYDACLSNTKSDLVIATSLVAMAGSFLMGVFANMPFALAPGMGTNAYFAYNMVGFHGSGPLSYETALTVIMLEGVIFLVLSTFGLRAKLARVIPRTIRLASAAGIGPFLAFSGLQAHQGLGLIGPSESTLVTLSSKALLAPTFWLGVLGFIITSVCLAKDLKGSMIYGIVFVTVVSWFRHTSVTVFPDTKEGNMGYEYFKKVLDFHILKTTVGKISFHGFFTKKVLIPLVTLLYVDILDTTGSMYSMAEYGGFTDEKGKFEGEYRAFIADASTTILSAVLGTTTVTTFLESTAGIKEGGRTGLTAFTVAFYFMLSLFFAPLFTNVPPWAVGPSLVLVGVMMMKMVKDIDWGDMKEAVPAFLTMLLMPLTFSISNGIIAGLGVYVLINAYDYLVYGLKWLKKTRKMMTESRNQISVDSAEISSANV